jgi:hypothetical protein
MLNYRRTVLLLGLLITASALACSLDFGAKEPSKPLVEILSPLNNSQVALGEEVTVQCRVVDETGVSRVELETDAVIVAVQRSDQAQVQTSMRATLPWTPTAPGLHTLLVYAYNTDGVVSDAVGVTIEVTTSDATPTVLLSLPTETATLPVPSDKAAFPTPTETRTAATPEPPTPTNTVVPPTVAPPTATITPPSPTPTPRQVSCPTLTIRQPSRAPASGPFGIEFDKQGTLPTGGGSERYWYAVEYRVPNGQWIRLPVPASVDKRGDYWMAEVGAPGAGEFWWRICLVNPADSAGPSVCCSNRKVITHGDY